jgi:retron-type reverse transcriptase
MIKHGKWVEESTTKMYLVGEFGKIIAEIDCVKYPMIWRYKDDKYISREAAQEAAQAQEEANEALEKIGGTE